MNRPPIIRVIATTVCVVLLQCSVAISDDIFSLQKSPFDAIATQENDPRSGADRWDAEGELKRLWANVKRETMNGQMVEAVATQQKIIAVFESYEGKNAWRTKAERALLVEIERVSKLSENDQAVHAKSVRLFNEGVDLGAKWELEMANAALGEALEGLTSILGEHTMSNASISDKLLLCKFGMSECCEAKKLAASAAAVWEKWMGKDNAVYAHFALWAGSASLELKELDSAEALFRQTLTMHRKLFGVKNMEYANTLSFLSRVLVEQQKLVEAEAVCFQVMVILNETRCTDSVTMGRAACSLAEVQIANSEYANAADNL